MLHLEKISSARLTSLDPTRTVFFFPVAPLEDHGPHLPMGLALEKARALCRIAAERLESEQEGWTAVLMPAAPLGIDATTAHAVVTVRAHVLRDWLVDSCQGLSRLGFRNFACFTGHLGPRQLTAIEEAGIILRGRRGLRSLLRSFGFWRTAPVLVSASSALTDRKTAFESVFWLDPPEHGGALDTSVALALTPEQVDASYAGLPRMEKNPSRWARLVSRRRGRLAGYWGAPAEARADAGRRALEGAVSAVFAKLQAVWAGANPEGLFRSWYSIFPPNWSFYRAWLLFAAVFALLLLWFIVSFERMTAL